MDIEKYQTLHLPLSSQWSWLPQSASTLAADYDWLFNFWVWTCGGLFLLVVVPMIYFAFRYKRKEPGQKALTQKDHNVKLEIAWTVLPIIYLTFLFHWGFVGYAKIYTAPVDSKALRVTAKKWQWQIDYPQEDQNIRIEGTSPVIGVELNQPVQLTMSSTDVLHSFFVPNFRVKQDLVPGRYTQLWFQATELGEFPVFCAEYCGTGHSTMAAIVKVMEHDEYQAWVNAKAEERSKTSNLSPLELGKKLYSDKACKTCHSVDGKPGIAPTFKGVYGHTVELTTGQKVLADDNYIRESILLPNAKIVKGFAPVMPSFQGQLKEEEIVGLIEFIKSLK